MISCGEEQDLTPFVTEVEISIGQYLEDNEETYSIFNRIVQESGVMGALKLYNPYGNGNKAFTLFLPQNSAFDDYMSKNAFSSVDEMLNDSLAVDQIARLHLVASSYQSNEFPYGSMEDSTFTGDFLYMGFDENLNYKVNNSVDIVQVDIELSNGFIHIVDGILEPIEFNSYEYLEEREEYSLITKLFEITGLADTMDVFRTAANGTVIPNYYTLMLETDDVFARYGINNIDSLIARYATPGLDYNEPENGLYQFAAYHILESKYAINEFEDIKPYVTYAYNPLSVDATQDIVINKGIPVFDTILVSGDSIPLDYIRLNLYESNAFSLNGPIHTLMDLLVIQEPTGTYQFQFENELTIFENFRDASISPFELSNSSELVNLSWTGVESIFYLAGISGPGNGDCLYAFGNFSIDYITPNVSPGTYELFLRVEKGSQAPQVKIFLDGVQQKSIVDLTLGRTGYRAVNFGIRRFDEFGPHTIRIETVVGGEFYWDWVQFRPL